MKFVIEPFLIDFEVYHTDNPKGIVKNILKRKPCELISEELKRDWLKDDGTMASACAGYIGDNFTIITIFDKRIKGYFESSIAHESVHVLSYIMKHSGVRYDNDNDEFSAYMVDYIVRMILKAK